MKRSKRYLSYALVGALACAIPTPIRSSELTPQQKHLVQDLAKSFQKVEAAQPGTKKFDRLMSSFLRKLGSTFSWTLQSIGAVTKKTVKTVADPVFWLKLPERLLMLTALAIMIILIIVFWPSLKKAGVTAKWVLDNIRTLLNWMRDGGIQQMIAAQREAAMRGEGPLMGLVAARVEAAMEAEARGVEAAGRTLERALGPELVEKIKTGEVLGPLPAAVKAAMEAEARGVEAAGKALERTLGPELVKEIKEGKGPIFQSLEAIPGGFSPYVPEEQR